MNWYKLLFFKFAQHISGEYWFDNSGQAMYADGDVGDMNHEAHVIQSVQAKYADDQFNRGEYVDWDGFLRFAAQEDYTLQMEEAQNNPQQQQAIKEEYEDDITPFVERYLTDQGMTPEEMQIASGRGDAREYAMKNWGWKRVQGVNIETWTLTSRDLNAISSGLYEAYNESVESSNFNIYIYTNQKWFRDIPYDIISSGNVNALQQYQNV